MFGNNNKPEVRLGPWCSITRRPTVIFLISSAHWLTTATGQTTLLRMDVERRKDDEEGTFEQLYVQCCFSISFLTIFFRRSTLDNSSQRLNSLSKTAEYDRSRKRKHLVGTLALNVPHIVSENSTILLPSLSFGHPLPSQHLMW